MDARLVFNSADMQLKLFVFMFIQDWFTRLLLHWSMMVKVRILFQHCSLYINLLQL
jgi:hypothetical protein